MKMIIGASGAVGIPTIKNMIQSRQEFCVLSSSEKSAIKLRAMGVVNVIVGSFREDGVLDTVMHDVKSVCYIPARHIEDWKKWAVGRGWTEYGINNYQNMCQHYDEHGYKYANKVTLTAILGREPLNYSEFIEKFVEENHVN